MARFFNEDHEKVFVLAPQMEDNQENFLVHYNKQLIELFSSHDHQQAQPIEIETYSSTTTSTDRNSQSAGLNEYYYKGIRRIIAGHIQFHSEAQAERAYALFNDTSITVTKGSSRKSRIRLELLYYDQTPIDFDDSNINSNNNNNNEILPALLHIRGVPPTIQHWFPETFDTFRKQGRLIKCQRRHRCAIHQSNMQKSSELCLDKHDSTIIVQYMFKEESDKAMSELNGSKLFETCTLSIIVKNTPPSYPSEKSSEHGKRPSSFSKIKTSGHVRLPHDSLASPSASSTSSSSTTFQQQRTPQQRYQQRQYQQQQQQQQQQQKKSIDVIEKQPSTPNSTTVTTTLTSSPTKSQRLELKPAMDLCNIYIKHIDPSIKSTELFNLFKPFGRIISARVMEDASTSTSRGFGFVSYSHPTEAAAALLGMDGYTGPKEDTSLSDNIEHDDDKKPMQKEWLGEPMSVRFHEPRVPRPERDHQQQVLKLFQSQLAPHFSFDHVLPTVTPDMPNTGVNMVDMNSPSVAAGNVANTGGLVHLGTAGGGGGGIGHHHHHHHHPPPPPPLMMPSHHQHSPTAYYSPYSPSPTQSSQPVSPFTLQHHPYMYSPHSPYVIPHSPRGTTTNSTYYYYYPQQQPHVMPEYYTPTLPPQQQQIIHHSHQQYQQTHRPYSPTKYQQQQVQPMAQQDHPLQKTEDVSEQETVTTVNEMQQQKSVTTEAITSNDGEEDKESIASDISDNSNCANKSTGEIDGGRQRLLEAIQQKLPKSDTEKISTVVDKLMATLNRKERSLCLFNEDYLEHRIKQAFECQL